MHEFAVNSAQVTELLIELMDRLHDKLFAGVQPDVNFRPNQGSGSVSATPSTTPSGTVTISKLVIRVSDHL